jgi:hypothetical protein
MDFSRFDFSKGKAFSAKVAGALGSKVCSSDVPLDCGFFLLVSFSRNRFRLTEESVNICLQSILGGQASDFRPFLMEDQIFKFSVSSKKVAFMVLALSPVVEDLFKLAFFLCNDSGFNLALRFAKADSGPSFSWEPVRKKKSEAYYKRSLNFHSGHPFSPRPSQIPEACVRNSNHSYDRRREVSFNNSSSRPSFAQVTGVLRPPLSGANAVPIGRVPPNPLSLVVLKSSRVDEIPRRLDQFFLGFISLGDPCLIDWVLRLVFKIQMGFQIAYSVNGPPLLVGWLAQL